MEGTFSLWSFHQWPPVLHFASSSATEESLKKPFSWKRIKHRQWEVYICGYNLFFKTLLSIFEENELHSLFTSSAPPLLNVSHHFFSLPLPVLLQCDCESDSPSSLRIEFSFMIGPLLCNQPNRALVKWSEITWEGTVDIKTAARKLWDF